MIAERAGRPLALQGYSARRSRDGQPELGGVRFEGDAAKLAGEADIDVFVEFIGGG